VARLTLQRRYQGLPDAPAPEGRMHSDPAHGRSSLRLREEGRVGHDAAPKFSHDELSAGRQVGVGDGPHVLVPWAVGEPELGGRRGEDRPHRLTVAILIAPER
jgi:hypothetical protein